MLCRQLIDFNHSNTSLDDHVDVMFTYADKIFKNDASKTLPCSIVDNNMQCMNSDNNVYHVGSGTLLQPTLVGQEKIKTLAIKTKMGLWLGIMKK